MGKVLRISENRFRDLISKSVYLECVIYFDSKLFIEIIEFKPEYINSEFRNWKINILKFDILEYKKTLEKSYNFLTNINIDYLDDSEFLKYGPYERRKLKKIFQKIHEEIQGKSIEEILLKSKKNQNSVIPLSMELSKLKNINILNINSRIYYEILKLDKDGYNSLDYNVLGNERTMIDKNLNIKNHKLKIKKIYTNGVIKPNPYDILESIKEERNSSEKKLYYSVKSSVRIKDILKIFIDLDKQKSGKLDEELEGAKIWWVNGKEKKPSKSGYGEILSVDIESEIINVRFFKGEKPDSETMVTVYPKEYLDSLEKLWTDSVLAKSAIDNYYSSTNLYDYKLDVPKEFDWLRENQQKSFELFRYNRGILWGPPGTGKTTTLGTLIASYMKENPQKKVLLLSLTNLAVDQLLESVDKQLGFFEYGDEIQKKCVRLGSNMNSIYYKDKNYLVASKDEYLLEQLIILENKKPDKKDALEYSEWLKEYENLKQKIKLNINDLLNKKNLLALTTTRALFEFKNLEDKPFDLVVFDEASQINLPQAIMLSKLGKQIIFAGDQEQLNPICISKNSATKEFMENSIFQHSNSLFKESNYFLNEQSRMSESICNIVSGIFYNNKLIVSLKEKENERWLKERELEYNDLIKDNSVYVENISSNGLFSQKYKGFIRYESAEYILNLCKSLVVNYREEDIVVLVPFKAQKNLILNFLKKERLNKIKVSTVHKSQGSEYHTVIFDPIKGDEKFLRTKEAKNLINVALSRAKARLVLCFSKEDKENEYFNKIDTIVKYSSFNKFNNLKDYIDEIDYPLNLIGKEFNTNLVKGKVIEISEDLKKVSILCFDKGIKRVFLLKYLEENLK